MKNPYDGNFILYKDNTRVLKAPLHRNFILYAVGLKSKTVFRLKRFHNPNLVMNDWALSLS